MRKANAMDKRNPLGAARRGPSRRGALIALVGAALAAGLLIAPAARAHDLAEFDGALAENQQTLDGYYDCVSWWYQDEGALVQHVNTFDLHGRTVTYAWATPSGE